MHAAVHYYSHMVPSQTLLAAAARVYSVSCKLLQLYAPVLLPTQYNRFHFELQRVYLRHCAYLAPLGSPHMFF